jgi:hypothetical protein
MPEDKLHLHWRLSRPAAEKSDHDKLKRVRRLAARIVGGDLSNVPTVHCLRWPGSWHRKDKPRIAEIFSCNPDREVDLDEALAALVAVAPPEPPASDNEDREPSADWQVLIDNIIEGVKLHVSLRDLAAKMIASGAGGGAVTNQLRALMNISKAPRDDRWEARYDGRERGEEISHAAAWRGAYAS